jgi:thymidylate synthase|uniref:thymidylate synthase n=1 Tax=viral metagenome TaxID=1070528 RepID=A0A6C0IR96_9ZZZZ
MSNHEEYQYLHLIENILQNGVDFPSRNGMTKSIFGNMMRFSLNDGTIPILTTKKVAWKTCFKELQWFIKGHTNNQLLKDVNVNIWNDNGSKQFLEQQNLPYEEDDLGPIYGHQWRHFNAEYTDCHADYTNKGIDQLKELINNLKSEEGRKSRRLLISAWNPCQIKEMALPPCHVLMQFYVSENKYLSCSLYQRSGDVGLGVPFNIASYSFLTHILAKHCDLIPKDFVYFLGNAHIYEEHIDALKEQIQRTPFEFPKILMNEKKENIEDYDLTCFEFTQQYTFHKAIKMEMKA